MIYKINDQVLVDNILCEIVDIIVEDGTTYYEVYPIEFRIISMSRFVTNDKIKKER